jgi:quinol monooxygenase YgiN
MSRMVIAVFRPKPGKGDALRAVVTKHWRVLHEQGLVTDRPRYAMQSADGTIIEVFEWCSREAIDAAHKNAAVGALWAEFEAACDYIPIAAVPEAQRLFSEFGSLPI